MIRLITGKETPTLEMPREELDRLIRESEERRRKERDDPGTDTARSV